jgi:hypothetical protein
MKDTEKLTLKAFLFALSQQNSPLPDKATSSMQEIAESLESRIMDLDDLALELTALKEPYKKARRWLTTRAAERGMGLDFLPATDDGGASDRETPNITRDVRSEIEKMEQLLAEIDAKIERAPSILAAVNPVRAAQSTFQP